MATQIFVNLPVKDLQRSIAFFTALGYTFNLDFTNENATCMVVGDNIFVMLLVEEFFKTFIRKEICDARKSTEVLLALPCDNRARVDEQIAKAVAAGATMAREPQDLGFMYSQAFEDPDGHIWELFYMEPQAQG
jgi:predicted lactoylglutathione lyase